MDLAKIRKKYRQPSSDDSSFRTDVRSTTPEITISDPVVGASISTEAGVINHIVQEKIFKAPAAGYIDKAATYRDPIEIIIAGRKASGCDEEFSDEEEHSAAISENCLEYLSFRVSDEIYGINIMNIKEIIKPREVTEIPRSPEFVSGIISLRGTIIPIIDMRNRLGLPLKNVSGKERIVVIKNDLSFSGLLVDEVIQVVSINIENMEPAPSVLEGIDRDFVSGIGRSEGRLIIILNLESIADIHLY